MSEEKTEPKKKFSERFDAYAATGELMKRAAQIEAKLCEEENIPYSPGILQLSEVEQSVLNLLAMNTILLDELDLMEARIDAESAARVEFEKFVRESLGYLGLPSST